MSCHMQKTQFHSLISSYDIGAWKILQSGREHFELYLITQLTFTCLKSTTETLEKRVKYAQS